MPHYIRPEVDADSGEETVLSKIICGKNGNDSIEKYDLDYERGGNIVDCFHTEKKHDGGKMSEGKCKSREDDNNPKGTILPFPFEHNL
jgi:hypothetical protein